MLSVPTFCLQASSLQQQPTAAYGLPKVALLGKMSLQTTFRVDTCVTAVSSCKHLEVQTDQLQLLLQELLEVLDSPCPCC